MSPLTQAIVTALTMPSQNSQPLSAQDILDTYLSAAELRRRILECPEHLFSTDDLGIGR